MSFRGGQLPPVAHQEEARQPSASERAYDVVERPAQNPLDMSLNEVRTMLASEPSYESTLRAQGGVREETASNRAMRRLAAAQRGIEHLNREVFIYGAGNQLEDVVASKGVARSRTQDLRDTDKNKLNGNREHSTGFEEGLHAQKAQHWHAGACDDYAKVMMDWLRTNLPGEKLTRVAHDKHAFVIIGDRSRDTDDELVVADPWPTRPQACTWKDHFCYTTGDVKQNAEMTADGKDVSAAMKDKVNLAKKPTAKSEKQKDGALQDTLSVARAKDDMWFQRTTTDDGKAIFYIDPSWTPEEKAVEKENFIQGLLRAQHLNADARKRLGEK